MEMIDDPLTNIKAVSLKDNENKPVLWLCRYDQHIKGPLGLVKHCPFKAGPHESCLYEKEGGPFPLDSSENKAEGEEKEAESPLHIVENKPEE